MIDQTQIRRISSQVHGEEGMSTENEQRPDLPFEAGQDTCKTLHQWTQIVGKIRLLSYLPPTKQKAGLVVM